MTWGSGLNNQTKTQAAAFSPFFSFFLLGVGASSAFGESSGGL